MAKNTKNPRNASSGLFKSLTKIFSGPIVDRRAQATRHLRRSQMDKHSSRFRSTSGQEFKRSRYSEINTTQLSRMSQHNRNERYVDFDQMEYEPIIASALDIYADEMTTHSSLSPMLNIACPNEEIKAVLGSLYHEVMNIEHNLFGWCRSMCKYGDFFIYLDIDEKVGITSTIGVPTQEMVRLEGEDKSNPNYIQYQWNTAGMTFENWQVGHFRVLGNDKYAPYGTSVLEAARRIWRQLTLLEDAMMAYRIVRAPERKVFKIDVGQIPPNEVEQYMQKVITSMKRNSIVDADSGRVDLRYNPLSVEEDYFIPVRGGSATEITNIAGGTRTGDIDDVKYLKDKLFAALKVPASYLTNAEGADEDKTTLAQKDIRFARTVQRLQRAVVSELEKIGIIHLYTLGYDGEDLLNFKLSLNNPSIIAELQELERWDKKFDVAGRATEGFFSRRWVAENVFNLSHEEFIRNQRELYYDRKFDANLAATAEAEQEAVAASMAGGGGGEDLGGDLGGDDLDLGGDDLGGDDLGGDLGGDDLGGDDLGGDVGGDEGGEEDVLLSAPGKRNDDSEEVRKAKDRIRKRKAYNPVANDGRKTAGRAKNYKSKASIETSTRTTLPGYMGPDGLGSLAKGLFEDGNTIYESRFASEEKKLLKSNREAQDLIKELKRSELKKNETEAQ
tara:strand:- start:479 stop:2494 length:2016 start_codon:yes stop_codon:yes gene_type:complete